MQNDEINEKEPTPKTFDKNQSVHNPEPELTDATTAEAEPVASMEVRLTEANDKYLRLFAEFDNYKKRMERERKDMTRFAGQELLTAILPVVDDFDRAIKSMTETQGALYEGVQLIHRKFRSILESKGVKAMDAAGKPFDTEFHKAIAQIPAPSEDQKGMVIDEVTKGYFLHDRVLRYAEVVVGV